MTDSYRQAGAVEDLPQVIDGVDVDAVATAVTDCPSVSGLSGGSFGATTSLLPGRSVSGVRVESGEVRVEVRARWGATAATVAREIASATTTLLAGHRLHVVIADIDLPSESGDPTAPEPAADSPPGSVSVPPPSQSQKELS